ncbi:HNH endonuclease [Haliangium ochraceum]|uniref:HNH endonuclease n=1 Tax=Haliangium ochraceum TaxID=80816 RepID=UPI003B8392C4
MKPNEKRNKRARVIARDGARCWLCGNLPAPGEWTLDHVVPKSEGGGNQVENLRGACRACNQGRHR